MWGQDGSRLYALRSGQVKTGRVWPFLGHSRRPVDPLDRRQVRPVPVAGADGVPLAGPVLEPSPPVHAVRAVLGVPSPVLVLDEPEALARQEAETLGIVGELGHGARIGRGSDMLCTAKRGVLGRDNDSLRF